MRRPRSPLLLIVACLALGFLATMGLLVLIDTGPVTSRDGTDGGRSSLGAIDASPVDAFMAAYRRSLESSYAIDGEFVRTMPDGRQLRSGVLVAQRPPDHIRRQLGAVTGVIADRQLNCSTDSSGRFSCADGAPARPYPEEIERRVSVMRSYFDPSTPAIYEVTDEGGGCFDLELIRPFPGPSYGVFARMCFDSTTGAMAAMELRREDGSVDSITATTIRQPTDLDFDLARRDAYESRASD